MVTRVDSRSEGLPHPIDDDRIVVGVDGSVAARHALRFGLDEARRRGAHLQAIHVSTARVSAERALEEGQAFAADELRAALVGSMPLAPAAAKAVAIAGDPGAALVSMAAPTGQLVVGSRGRGGFASLLLGSVSQKCLTHASFSVTIVPAGWDPDVVRSVVVAGVDDSDESFAALRWAIADAARRRCALSVVHAWHIPAMPASAANTPALARSHLRQEVEAHLRSTVDEALAAATERPVATELCMPEEGAARALLAIAARADHLVVAARGHGGITGALLGSVSQQCTRHAACPVTVVRDG